MEFWRRGSAWFFGAHLFGFPSRGPIFGPRDPNLDPGFGNWARAGPGRFLEQKWGPKNMVLRGDGLQIGDYGISRDPNGLYGTWEAFGKASFPPTPFKKWFPSTFPKFGKFGEGPPGPLCISYGPFVGPYGPPGSAAWPKAYCIRRTSSEVAGRAELLLLC